MKDLLIFANKKCFWIHSFIDWLNYGAISEISQCAGIFFTRSEPSYPAARASVERSIYTLQ